MQATKMFNRVGNALAFCTAPQYVCAVKSLLNVAADFTRRPHRTARKGARKGHPTGEDRLDGLGQRPDIDAHVLLLATRLLFGWTGSHSNKRVIIQAALTGEVFEALIHILG